MHRHVDSASRSGALHPRSSEHWRRGLRWMLVVLALTLMTVWIDAVNLLQPGRDGIISNNTKVARYVLARWPRNFDEVREANFEHRGSWPPRETSYDSIEFIPSGATQCTIIFRGRNLIGFPFVVKRIVEYTRDDESRLAKEARHR